ncbi:MAG TPA: hypothetical protein VK196_22555 [Magnetospirillum sp.]|nr:hypothetical protein [Magnetospirillum sp.]
MTRLDEISDRLFMANESRAPSNPDRPPEGESLWHLTDSEAELWSAAKGADGDIAYLLQLILDLEAERECALHAVYKAWERGVITQSWKKDFASAIEGAKKLIRCG